jgi:serine/threonine protein kinase
MKFFITYHIFLFLFIEKHHLTIMDQYKLEYEKGSGTFSVVFTALSLKTGKYVAIKCMKKKFDSLEKVKKLKEIQALNILSSHENIIKMIEALYDEPSGICLNYHRKTSSSILTYGDEFVLGIEKQEKSSYIPKNKVLHVSSAQSFVIHAQKRYLP